jgi:cobalt/nickel transport system permease protein
MQHEFLDRYSRGDGPLHRASPTLKLLLALAIILTASLTPAGFLPLAPQLPISLVHLALGAMVLAAVQISGIPWSYFLLRLAALAPPLALMALSIPLARGFEGGWPLMAAVTSKGILSLATVLVLVNCTPFDQLLAGARRLGLPRVLAGTLSCMYRYHFVLMDELARMTRAQQARTFCTSRASRTAAAARLVGPLLVRSFERSERVQRAMLARGFTGEARTLDPAK